MTVLLVVRNDLKLQQTQTSFDIGIFDWINDGDPKPPCEDAAVLNAKETGAFGDDMLTLDHLRATVLSPASV